MFRYSINKLLSNALLAGFACLCGSVHAQEAIAVSKEPLHKNVLTNRYVRVLDLHIKPGDTTQFHKHETPCVSTTLHAARTGSQTLIDDKSPRVPSTDRRINFDMFQSPRIHRVWNRDTATYYGIDVEVLTKGEASVEEPITTTGFTQVLDALPVRTYRFTISANQQTVLKRTAPLLIISLSNSGAAMVNKKQFNRQGDFLFVEPSQEIVFANGQDGEYSFVVPELKR